MKNIELDQDACGVVITQGTTGYAFIRIKLKKIHIQREKWRNKENNETRMKIGNESVGWYFSEAK